MQYLAVATESHAGACPSVSIGEAAHFHQENSLKFSEKLPTSRSEGIMRARTGGPAVEFLNNAPDVINKVFDILELIVVRLVLLGLAAFGAYALLLSRSP